MFFDNRKKKLKKEFKLEDSLYFSKGTVEIFVDYNLIVDQIEKSPDSFNEHSISSFFYLLLEAQILAIFKDKKAREILLNQHQKLISNGTFDIWNNELFYHQQNYIATQDLIAYFLDNFQKQNPIFSNLNIGDIKKYFKKEINLDNIKVLEHVDDYFKQNSRIENIYKTIEFLEDLSFYFYDIKLDISDYYKHYDFNSNFEDNLREAIDNYDEFKIEMKEKPINVFLNRFKTDKENLYIGKYIDFKSLYSEALFIVIPKFKDRFIISVSKSEETDSAKNLVFSIFDIELNNDASENIYNEVIEILKKP